MDNLPPIEGKRIDSENISRTREPFELLQYIYSIVNEQTKFAESKNAALLVFNSGLIVGYLSLLPYNINNCPIVLLIYSFSFVIFNIISIVFCIFSIIPILDNSEHISEATNNKTNIFFFKDIAAISEKELVERVYDDLELIKNENEDQISLQISHEVIIISRITVRKYMLFNRALWFTLFGLITPFLAGFVYFLTHKKK